MAIHDKHLINSHSHCLQLPAEEDIDLSDIDLDDWDTQKDELWEPEDNFVSWETMGCGWIG